MSHDSRLFAFKRMSRSAKFRNQLLLASASLAIIAASAPALATTDFLSFATSNNFTGCTTRGSVNALQTKKDMSLGDPAHGGPKAFTLTPATGQSMAWITPANSSVVANNIDALLHLNTNSVDAAIKAMHSGVNSSSNYGVLTEAVQLDPGTYTFYWSYAAGDYATYFDGVFFSLANASHSVNQVTLLATVGPVPNAGSATVVANYGATPWAAYSFNIAATDTYYVSFADYNWDDMGENPNLFIGASAGTVTSGSASPIDTTKDSYPVSGLGSTVTPEFKGGTLLVDVQNPIQGGFSVGNYAGNAIDAHGQIGLFSGAFEGAGGLTIKDTASGGRVIFTGANTYSGGTTIASGATLQLGNGGTTGSIVGNVINNGTLIYNRSDSITYTGVISGGGGVSVAGGGIVILNGANTYTGPTTVSAGSLIIGDVSHPTAGVRSGVTVSSGAIVGGYGSIGGNLVASGGIVSPGNSIGTLTVSGNYTQSATGALKIELSPTASDKLVVGGTAQLGGTLQLSLSGSGYGTKSVSFLTANAVSGTFSTVTYSGASSDMVYGVVYGAKEVDLAMTPKTSGQIYGDLVTAGIDTAAMLDRVTLDHLGVAASRGWSVWSRIIGGASLTDGDAVSSDFNSQLWGVTSGVDYQFSGGAKLSGVFAYTRNQLGISDLGDKASGEGYFFSLAAHLVCKRVVIDVTGFVQRNTADVTRVSGSATAKAGNVISGGSAEAAYPIGDVAPFARLTVTSLHANGFAESSALPLSIDTSSRTSIRGVWGVKISHDYTTSTGAVLSPRFVIGLQDELGQGGRDISMRFAGTAFMAPSVAPDVLSGIIDASLTAKVQDRLEFSAGASGRWSSNQREGVLNVGLRYSF